MLSGNYKWLIVNNNNSKSEHSNKLILKNNRKFKFLFILNRFV